jgi:hypothetical protein
MAKSSFSEESKVSPSSGNIDSWATKDDQNDNNNAETAISNRESQQKIKEEERYTIFESRLYNIKDGDFEKDTLETTDKPEIIVRDLESRHLHHLGRRKLPPQAREILLLTASLHINEGRGITVMDLQRLGFEKDNAEKKLYDGKKNGLLIPGDKRKGHKKQYYLSNYKYIIDAKHTEIKPDKEIRPDDDLLVQLIRILSNRKYVYHHIHINTELCYIKDYDILKWRIPSLKNKQKIDEFKLNMNRKCSIAVSANGTVNIIIECTHEPYELHTPSGIAEFFGDCGQAAKFIKDAAKNRLYVVPSLSEWLLTQFDYNKDISIKESTAIQITSWSLRVQLRYLGALFQIYPKGLPDIGECIRFEGQHSSNKKEKVIDTVSDIYHLAYVFKPPLTDSFSY